MAYALTESMAALVSEIQRRRAEEASAQAIASRDEAPAWLTGEDTSGLTPKQRFFILEYIKDFNGTAAAIRAGYS